MSVLTLLIISVGTVAVAVTMMTGGGQMQTAAIDMAAMTQTTAVGTVPDPGQGQGRHETGAGQKTGRSPSPDRPKEFQVRLPLMRLNTK